MLDFFLDYLLLPILMILFIGVCAAIFVGLQERDKQYKYLLKQCIEDGKKEYECHALLRDPTSNTVVVPMPVVIGR